MYMYCLRGVNVQMDENGHEVVHGTMELKGPRFRISYRYLPTYLPIYLFSGLQYFLLSLLNFV